MADLTFSMTLTCVVHTGDAARMRCVSKGFWDRYVLNTKKGSKHMNASQSYYDGEEVTYRVGGTRRPEASSPSRPDQARRSGNVSRRRGKAPAQHNGIHRRRKKRITW